MSKRQSVRIYKDDGDAQTISSPTMSEKSGIKTLLHEPPEDNPTPSSFASLAQNRSTDTVVPPPGDSPRSNQDSDMQYITGYKLAGLVIGMTVAIFLIYLDNSIISTATPIITADLHETADIGWYAGAYTLVSGTLQPLAGKLYIFFRKKFVFLTFLFVFEIGSLICALANSSSMLIAGRAVAGAGSSGLMNGAWTIVGTSVPLAQQPFHTGIMMGVGQMALVVGPLIGGALTQYVSWRWCFYINLPIGACAAILIVFNTIPDIKGQDAFSLGLVRRMLSSLDLGGFALLAPAMAMFLAALQFGGSDPKYPWSSSLVIGLFCGAGASAVLFVLWERRVGDRAIIPGSVIRRREVWSSCGHMFSMSFIVFIANYFLPIYFQAVKGVGATRSGLYMLPGIMSQLAFIILSGVAVSRLGYFVPWCLFGGLMIAVGAGLTTTFGPNTNTSQWVGYQLIQGIGRGAALTMSITAIQCALGSDLVAISMSLLIFFQNLAGSIAVVVATTIFTQSLLKDLPVLAPSVSPDAVVSSGTGADAVRGLLPAGSPELGGLLRAYSYAIDKTFYVVAGFAVASIGFALFMGWDDVRRKTKSETLSGGHARPEEQETVAVQIESAV